MNRVIPKKGMIAIGEYVVSGKVKKTLTLGIVKKATKNYFVVETEDFKQIERQYNFAASNGIRIKHFEEDKKSKIDTSKKESTNEG